MNYESYVPVGILKKAWIDKHTQEVPSVLVVFYELDWDDPDWDAKKLECQSRVEVVRYACVLYAHVCIYVFPFTMNDTVSSATWSSCLSVPST